MEGARTQIDRALVTLLDFWFDVPRATLHDLDIYSPSGQDNPSFLISRREAVIAIG